MIIFTTFAPMNHNRYLYWLILCLMLTMVIPQPAMARTSQKTKYPGGRYYIWRYTLKDKQGSPYSIEVPPTPLNIQDVSSLIEVLSAGNAKD